MSAALPGSLPVPALLPALLLGVAVLVVALPEPDRLRRVLPEQPRRGAGGSRGGRGLGLRRRWAGGGLRARVGLGVVAVVVPGAVLLGPAGAAAVGVVVLGAVVLVQSRRHAAAAVEERRGALAACAVLSAELRAGRPPGEALDAASEVAHGPFRDRLRAAAAALPLGGDPAGALVEQGTGPATSVPVVAAGLSACWRVCSSSGAGLAAAVERLEDGLRAAEAARRAVDAELAGPRATAVLLALLPLAGLALAAALGARPLQVLLGSPLGGVCLVLGVALDVAGLAWTRRLAAGAAVRA